VKRLRSRIEDDPGEPTLITTIRGLGYKLVPPA
jgi:two-component system response regulator RegX3